MFNFISFYIHIHLNTGAVSDTAVISLAAEKREFGNGWGSEELGISPEPNPTGAESLNLISLPPSP